MVLIIQMGLVSFHLSLFYSFYVKHKYIVIMQGFSLSQKPPLKVFVELGKGQVKLEFVVCLAFSITFSTLQRPGFPFFIFICMLLFEMYYSVEVSAFSFSSTNIMPHSLSQASPEQIERVWKYKQKTKVGKLKRI